MPKTKTKYDKKRKIVLRRPYLKNTLTLRCDLYSSERASRPLVSSHAQSSFDIKLIPLILTGLALIAGLLLSRGLPFSEKRKRKI